MISLKKYSLFIVVTLLISACANRATFEWIKINPDKIKEANTRVAYRNGIRNIDLTLDLKEKTTPIYYESPEAFEAGNSTPLVVTKPETIAKPITNRKVVNRPAVVAKKNTIPQPVSRKPIENKKVAPLKTVASKPVIVEKKITPKAEKTTDSVIPNEESIALDKLNGALKIPKKPIRQYYGEQKETKPQIKKEVKKGTQTNQKIVIAKPLNKQSPKVEQKIVQTEVKPSNEKNDKFKAFLNARKGNSFILAGAALAVIGVVLGLIFGKSAYLVSGAGVIFAAIGFILKL